jgi:hypothetical protein
MALLSLAACGGDAAATIGGSVSGLAAGSTLTLEDNASTADPVSVAGDGSAAATFAFGDAVGTGGGYNVTIAGQPLGQTCSVANGSGTVDGNADPVTGIAVTCTTTASVGVTIAGISEGESVTLTLTDTTPGTTVAPMSVTGSTNGSLAFQELLPAGDTYGVAVNTATQSCTVLPATGTVAAGTVADIAVTCI